MGNNDKGKLGLGDPELAQNSVPSLVEALEDEDIVQVSCGRNHTAAVTKSGLVYTWGEGKHNALGYKCAESQYSPKCVKYLVDYHIKISKVSCGWYTTGFLSENGDVFL